MLDKKETCSYASVSSTYIKKNKIIEMFIYFCSSHCGNSYIFTVIRPFHEKH